MTEGITLDTRGLDLLVETMQALARSSVDVGVFEENDYRTDGKSNASIGAIQEHGFPEKNIPVRSWLVTPLTAHLGDKVADLTLEGKKTEVVLEKIGLAAVLTIQEAFDSSGDGSWPPPKYRDGRPLVDTAQLENSVSYRIHQG